MKVYGGSHSRQRGSWGLREAIAQRYEYRCRPLNDRLGLQPQRETLLLYRRLLSQR
jgi:hypothetical protein